MKRITLGIGLFVAVGAAGAQEPPTPPPARPTRPAPAVAPAPTPRPAEPLFRYYAPDVESIRDDAARIAREHSRISADIAREHSRMNAEIAREQSRMTSEMVREQARITSELARERSLAAADMAREVARASSELAYHYAPSPAPVARPSIAFGREDFRVPRPQFAQGEPSDSLYRIAHDLLNRGDYGRAAQMFKEIGQKYPNTVYQNDLPYYEAFARYKIGTTPELEAAAKLLEPRAAKLVGVVQQSSGSGSYNGFNRGRSTSEGDVTSLYVRINSVLASRGNNNAASIVSKAAQAGGTCDREEISIKTEAMGALSQMDPATALPIVRRVLDKKDDCTTELRKNAVFMLGRRGDPESASLLASAAKTDPAVDVRVAAIGWLPKVQGDAGINMLEELLRTEQEERIQRAVVRTLTSSDNQRARNSMRALIDRKDVPLGLRLEAVTSFSGERSTTDDANYLRSFYSRADNDRLKDAVINAVARIGGVENDQWILNLARNTNEPSQFRATAISRLMRSNIQIADLMKLYDASDSYDIRTRIVSNLANRKDTESADKLVEIFRSSTVNNIKMQALNALNNRKDPRSAQLLTELFAEKKP